MLENVYFSVYGEQSFSAYLLNVCINRMNIYLNFQICYVL